MINRTETAICASVLLLSIAFAIYGQLALRRAAQIRVAACQMISNQELWHDWECPRAFREAQ